MGKEGDDKPEKDRYGNPGNCFQENLVGLENPLFGLFKDEKQEEPYQQKNYGRK